MVMCGPSLPGGKHAVSFGEYGGGKHLERLGRFDSGIESHRRLQPLVAQNPPKSLEVAWVPVDVELAADMPELVRRNPDIEMLLEGADDQVAQAGFPLRLIGP